MIDTLMLRDEAQKQLAQITTVEKGIEYLNKVKAIETWAKAEKKDAILQNAIAEQKLRTQKILGRLLKEKNVKEVGFSNLRNSSELPKETPRLKDLGINKKQSHEFQKIDSMPEELFEKEIAQAKDETNKRIELTTSRLLKAAKQYEKDTIIKTTKQERQEVNKNKALIYNESCVDFLKRFKNNSVDLLFTDPPYSTDVENIKEFVDTWLLDALDKVNETGRAFICIGAYPLEIYTYLQVLLNTDWIVDNPLVWTYRNTLGVTPKMKYNLNYQFVLHLYRETSKPLDNRITNEMFSVQDINAPDGRIGDRLHTWQKPSELARRLINHTTKEKDVIIDPFACTGTFIFNGAELGRKSYGCDIDINAINIAYERGCKKV
jgi:DNA modification methylase